MLIPNPESLIPSPESLEQQVEPPLHRSGTAGADHRVAAIDVRRRTDLPEDAAARARAQEAAEVHAVGQVEDFPPRLDPRLAAQLDLLQDVEIELREPGPPP